MRVVWTAPASADREQIVFFIAQDDPQAAMDMDSLLTDSAASLATFPARGRRGRVSGTREIVVHKNYILVYSIDTANSIVYIKAVLHAGRQYPPE